MKLNFEFQRYGRNKSTLVNSTYISSGEYRNKFDKITNNKNLRFGIVLCHNGKIFCYKSDEIISKMMYNLYVADYYLQLHDEYLAQIEALKELSEIYGIEFWEV